MTTKPTHTYANTHPMHYLHALDCPGCDTPSAQDLAFMVCECCLVLVLRERGRTCARCADHEVQGIVCKGGASLKRGAGEAYSP